MKKIFFLPVLVLLLNAASSLAHDALDFLIPYEHLLEKHVILSYKDKATTTLIDYKDWEKDPEYKTAIDLLLASRPSEIDDKREKMAYWINAYNLLTIDLVIREDETKSIKNLGSLVEGPWKRHAWVIEDQEYTLDQIRYLLRQMNDPRIHMALVNASISCPNLLRKPYNPRHLDSQLTQQSRLFLGNKQIGLQIDNHRVAVSPIFKWYTDDFEGMAGMITFIRHYSSDPIPEKPLVSYLSYNWSLNSQ